MGKKIRYFDQHGNVGYAENPLVMPVDVLGEDGFRVLHSGVTITPKSTTKYIKPRFFSEEVADQLVDNEIKRKQADEKVKQMLSGKEYAKLGGLALGGAAAAGGAAYALPAVSAYIAPTTIGGNIVGDMAGGLALGTAMEEGQRAAFGQSAGDILYKQVNPYLGDSALGEFAANMVRPEYWVSPSMLFKGTYNAAQNTLGKQFENTTAYMGKHEGSFPNFSLQDRIQGLSDLYKYISNGKNKTILAISPETKQVKWFEPENIAEGYIPFLKYSAKQGHPRNGRSGFFYVETDKGILKYNPELGATGYHSTMPAEFNDFGEAALVTSNGKTDRLVFTSPLTDSEGANLSLPNTLPKDLVKDFWINGRAITPPGTYISGDEIRYPFGKKLIDLYKNKGILASLRGLISKAEPLQVFHQGLSPDSYSSIIRQAQREGSKLRWGQPFVEWNSSAVNNKHIYNSFKDWQAGKISFDEYEKIFNDWALPLGGRPLQFVYKNGKKYPLHPHPFIYIEDSPKIMPRAKEPLKSVQYSQTPSSQVSSDRISRIKKIASAIPDAYTQEALYMPNSELSTLSKEYKFTPMYEGNIGEFNKKFDKEILDRLQEMGINLDSKIFVTPNNDTGRILTTPREFMKNSPNYVYYGLFEDPSSWKGLHFPHNGLVMVDPTFGKGFSTAMHEVNGHRRFPLIEALIDKGAMKPYSDIMDTLDDGIRNSTINSQSINELRATLLEVQRDIMYPIYKNNNRPSNLASIREEYRKAVDNLSDEDLKKMVSTINGYGAEYAKYATDKTWKAIRDALKYGPVVATPLLLNNTKNKK